MVRRYTSARFGSYSTGDVLTEEESKLLTGGLTFPHDSCFHVVFS